MEKFRVLQSLEVTVERVLPFGVFVRLPDGTQGYIRRRELDLDPDMDPSRVTRPGERIKAIVLRLGDDERDIELSRRASLPDPWPEFAQRYHVGDTVRGTVRAIQPHGIFVRIQAGIDGFVPLEELVGISIDKPENVFWLGDNVEAMIIRMQVQKKIITLSLTARLMQYDQALEAARAISQTPSNNAMNTALLYKEKKRYEIDAYLVEKVQPILVVEDDDHVRDSLTTWLKGKGLLTASAKTISQAMAMQSAQYKVFIVDLNLLEYDGLELIQHLRRQNNQAQICIMSSPQMLEQRAHDIEMAQVMEVFPKPLDLDEIERFLLTVVDNEKDVHFWRADSPDSHNLLQPAALQFSETQTLARLHQAMADIASTIRAKTGLLFQLDPDSQAISVPVQIGPWQINSSAVYGLRESPVHDVIQQEKSILENRVMKIIPRFDKLLNLLPFKSCVGVPIAVQGEIHHAVFFFHPEADAFPHGRLRDVQAGALLLSAILTDESIQARLRSLNPILLSGELAASFGHDVFNKITALELQTRNLAESDPVDHEVRSQKLLELVLDLKDTAQAFQQMLRTKEQMEAVDVNNIVQRACLLLRDFARKERTQIVLKLNTDLPLIQGNSILLQQAFVNIMLNAIQQTAQKAEDLRWNGRRILEVTSCFKEEFIQIRFKDNGPGIHRESLNKIFVPGFSTRGGSGLGLYIARSFIQMLGGTLKVEETLVPLGSTFLAELPPVKEGE